jgi:glucan phosphoethanolaminetransferase (alkaline phosphatase superfamily)
MIACGASNGFSRLPLASTFNYYFPFNIIYTIKTYYKNQKFQSEILRKKSDVTTEYTYKKTSEDPLIVVLIIGESMRGDLVSKATMPLLLNRPNVVNFSNARSFETSTRLSIPYMLTSAGKSNFDRSLGEKSIISIFKHMGFATSWVGNQGLFGIFETSFASIALESDNIIVKKDVRQAFPHEKIQDEHLLPFFDNAINTDYKKKFIVTHLLGSHYQFYERIPANFKRPFLPECKVSPKGCSKDSLINSYYNTLYYSDIVLNQIFAKLEDKNAIVIYASDHGMSLGEGGYFGNAYQGDNTPKEQLDIAMFTWASDKFIKNNPSYLNAQTHEKSAVNHGYIFHSLLDCTGVQSEYIDNNLSLCRKRK